MQLETLRSEKYEMKRWIGKKYMYKGFPERIILSKNRNEGSDSLEDASLTFEVAGLFQPMKWRIRATRER